MIWAKSTVVALDTDRVTPGISTVGRIPLFRLETSKVREWARNEPLAQTYTEAGDSTKQALARRNDGCDHRQRT